MVNDLGGSRSGDGSSSKAADTVVSEIRAAGYYISILPNTCVHKYFILLNKF